MAGQLLVMQQNQLAQYYGANLGALTREQFAMEMTLVARLAVAEGQYAPAAKLYELAGKHIGAIDTKQDLHQHVHLHNPNTSPAEYARASDEELRRIITEAEEARAKSANAAG